MSSNEAAERLRERLHDPASPSEQSELQTMLDEALAAERRATVERIREAMREDGGFEGENLDAILDEEAAR